MVALDGGGHADEGVAGAADGAGRRRADGVGAVEPLHVGGVVVPDGHGEDHGDVEGGAEAGHAAGGLEVVGVAEGSLLLVAELVAELVGRVNAGDVALGVGDGDAVLDVEAPDAGERAGGGVVGGDELRHDGDLLAGVDRLAGAEEGLVAHAVGVEVASVLVADALVSRSWVTAVRALAADESVALAGVGSVRRGVLVGLPDVHLSAAGSVAARAGVYIIGRRSPVENVGLLTVLVGVSGLRSWVLDGKSAYLAVDELHVVWALGIAVSSSVLGTSLVAWVLGHSSISIHLREVQSTVESARKVGHVNVEGELVVLQLEGLVGGVIRQKIDTGSNVRSGGSLGDELESQSIVARGDTVSARVVSSVKSAVRGAGLWIWADGGVPGVASVTVGVPGGCVQPSPVGIKNDLRVLGGAASSACADLYGHCWMRLCSQGADLLAADGGQKGEGSESKLAVHDGRCCGCWMGMKNKTLREVLSSLYRSDIGHFP